MTEEPDTSDRSVPRPAPWVSMIDIVFPEHTNSFNVMFGGNVLSMMDKASVMASVRFARRQFVTISCDDIQFLRPIHQADIIDVRARVCWVGRTSLITRVEVHREEMIRQDREFCACGWFALVARTTDGNPVLLPELILESDQDRQDFAHALSFRERSMERRAQLSVPPESKK